MISGTTENSEQIVKRSGSNLAFALAVLPPEKRHDMRIYYAFCRVIDDIADDPDVDRRVKEAGLEGWREIVEGKETAPTPGIEEEFGELIERRKLDRGMLKRIIDGVAMDLEPTRYETADDLKDYCFHVASAVGLVSLDLFGCENEKTRRYAEQLGYALQWTNIMRDVGEDAAEQRIYLPLEDLERFRIRQSDILSGQVPRNRFVDLMSLQSERAREFYLEATKALPDADRPAMRSPELMRRIYFAILQKMEKDDYRVFEKRYRLSKTRMVVEFLRAKYLG